MDRKASAVKDGINAPSDELAEDVKLDFVVWRTPDMLDGVIH